eukprot:CAMPEP_0171060768 /NCGR_PEP_ID=MMETSP0766_2-20121228/4026_1 /TAXON_ID=439317 /ORGANISM="Gambierdiscus australes, Strain CAWD 149" /LENGTH=163 /DNA_ID=CAMNT_0011516375 /DNA_START=28 /DNA_END=520 /DNA_ORIENTATION=+
MGNAPPSGPFLLNCDAARPVLQEANASAHPAQEAGASAHPAQEKHTGLNSPRRRVPPLDLTKVRGRSQDFSGWMLPGCHAQLCAPCVEGLVASGALERSTRGGSASTKAAAGTYPRMNENLATTPVEEEESWSKLCHRRGGAAACGVRRVLRAEAQASLATAE